MANSRGPLSERFDGERLRNQIGYKREVIDTNQLRVTVPTLPFESFDSRGEKVLPWHILKLLDSAQLRSFFPLDDGNPPKQIMGYLIYNELEIDSSFYSSHTPKFPLIIDARWRYVKRSSRSSVYMVKHPSRTHPYAKAEYIGVNVDPLTRKPIPFPESWKTKYGVPSEGLRRHHVIPEKDESTVTLVTEHKVSYSDIDDNGHANYSFYGRTCYNSFAENLFLDQLENDAQRYFDNGLKILRSTFLKECLIGDIVTVDSWRDQLSNDTYHFEVKKNGELCARVTFIFHKDSASTVSSKL